MLTKERTYKKRVPTYEIVELFPAQGEWTEQEYLSLDTNRLVELSEGQLEVLEMPSDFHQLLLGRLFLALSLFLKQYQLGYLRFAPLRVRLWPGTIREPDLVFMSTTRADQVGKEFWGVPDLVAEIISESNVENDRIVKMREYAQAGIPEYWIIDPYAKAVEVYLIQGEKYALHTHLREGNVLTSSQFPGFELSLTEFFAPE